MTITHFKAVIKAIAVLPKGDRRYRNLTAEGVGESKPAARFQAENSLREQVDALRGEFGSGVVLQFTSTPLFDEVCPSA
jgi:hypothetical protein